MNKLFFKINFFMFIFSFNMYTMQNDNKNVSIKIIKKKQFNVQPLLNLTINYVIKNIIPHANFKQLLSIFSLSETFPNLRVVLLQNIIQSGSFVASQSAQIRSLFNEDLKLLRTDKAFICLLSQSLWLSQYVNLAQLKKLWAHLPATTLAVSLPNPYWVVIEKNNGSGYLMDQTNCYDDLSCPLYKPDCIPRNHLLFDVSLKDKDFFFIRCRFKNIHLFGNRQKKIKLINIENPNFGPDDYDHILCCHKSNSFSFIQLMGENWRQYDPLYNEIYNIESISSSEFFLFCSALEALYKNKKLTICPHSKLYYLRKDFDNLGKVHKKLIQPTITVCLECQLKKEFSITLFSKKEEKEVPNEKNN